MSGHDDDTPGWATRIRRWLWLDRTQRTDNREVDRGFYPGGPPVYMSRRAPGWRFLLAIVAVGIVLALLIMSVRAAGSPPTDGEVLAPDERVVAVSLRAAVD